NATTENGLKTSKELVRIYVTGDCDGLPDMRDAFAAHPEVELVGWSAQVAEAAPTLTGGHLGVVLHATRAATLPVNELAAIREQTRRFRSQAHGQADPPARPGPPVRGTRHHARERAGKDDSRPRHGPR